MPSPSATVERFPRSSLLQVLRASDSTSPDDEPYIELSTPHANYAVGVHSRVDVAQSWQRVTVVLAALTSAKCNTCAYVFTYHLTSDLPLTRSQTRWLSAPSWSAGWLQILRRRLCVLYFPTTKFWWNPAVL